MTPTEVPPQKASGDGMLPLLVMLTIVLGLWAYIIDHGDASSPPRFGHRKTTSPFRDGLAFPPALPIISRDYMAPRSTR